MRRSLTLAAAAVFAATTVLGGEVAHADPPRPTDYRTDVESIDPPTPSIDVEIVGGDSFVQLTADEGTEVIVNGYDGEPYLWWPADGGVLENRNSPARWVNQSSTGDVDIPDTATAESEPDWREVTSSRSWAWHDHRTHWMSASRPAGLGPGDQILEGVVPIEVDGAPVEVRVRSVWLERPSPVPAIVGGLAGAAIAMMLWIVRGRRDDSAGLRLVGWTGVAMASLATVVGVVQFRSLPVATGPPLVWWALPVVAVVSFGLAVCVARPWPFWAVVANVVGGVELAVWGWAKRSGVTRALIPSAAPGWLDRFTVTLALVGGVLLAVVVVVTWLLASPDGGKRSVSASTAASG